VSNGIAGIIARFESSGELLKAAEKTRDAGYRKFDCHSPFPIHGMDKAMGLGRSKLGWLVGAAATIGASGALLLQWYASTVSYPLVISGKPFFSYPAYVPVTFALGVLFSAFTALLGMLILNGLPRFFHPIFYSDNFKRVTDDGFFMSVMRDDPEFDTEGTGKFLESIGGKDIELLREQK
jgi:hypothetical protein